MVFVIRVRAFIDVVVDKINVGQSSSISELVNVLCDANN